MVAMGKPDGVKPVPEWGRILLGAIGCFLLTWLGLGLATRIEAPLLWLADALLIVVVLDRSGRDLAVNLTAGAAGILFASLLAMGAPTEAMLVTLASILHVALARFLLLRFAPHAPHLKTAEALVHLLLWGALLSPMLGALVVSGTVLFGDGASSALQVFVGWWIASVVGTATLLPAILGWVHSPPSDLKLLRSRRREALLILALVALLAAIGREVTEGFPLLLGLPLILWTALRLDFRITSLLCAVLALLPLAGAAIKLWPSPDEVAAAIAPVADQQAFLLAIILPALFASLFSQEQRAGDQARRAALRALRAVMDAVPLAILTSTAEGKVSLWSRGAERIFGWRRSEVEGIGPPFVAAEQAAEDASLRQRVLAGNEIQNKPVQRRDQTGALRDLVMNAMPQRDDGGAITGIISVMEDVTDRRRLEASREEHRARLAAILDAVADPIITSDEHGTITSFSRAAETVFGYAASEVIGRNLNMLMPEPDRSRHDSYLRRYRETAVKRIIGTNRRVSAQRKDGSRFPAELTISEAWLDGTRIFAGLLRDLSLKPDATSEHKPKTDPGATKFLSRITHDLRQPLHAMSLMTGALERRSGDPDTREIVGDLSQIVRSLQSTFENIAEWTRLEGGLIAAAPVEVKASGILASLAQEFGPEAVRRNLALRWVPSSAPIACDPVLVQRILRQFLDNAMKFTPSGKVVLGARRRGSRLRLVVADSGIGIPEDQRDLIFVEYSQLDPGREAGGVGLGLAIARRLAELAGLEIGMCSIPGKGSLFWVETPLSLPPQ